MKVYLILLLFFVEFFGFSLTSNDAYKKIETSNYTIIYTDKYKNEVAYIQYNLDQFLRLKEKEFGYKLDEPLRLVLVSNKNQIPNAFSTQVPYNMIAFYNGGSGMNDYFSNKSWLETLFVHEMVHNYQLNAKKSKVSQTMHKYLGNNYMPLFVSIVPFFTLPNLLMPSFLLEGNSVLHESLYNNGGRLYSGIHKGMKNSLLFGGKITPQTLINDHISFPYMTEKYIIGGFFMKYLAQKYQFEKVNKFFLEHSSHYINPYLLEQSFKKVFGKTLYSLIEDFVRDEKKKNIRFKTINKPLGVKSQDVIYLSKIEDGIYFITNDRKNEKKLYKYKNKVLSSQDTKLPNGKLFKTNGAIKSASAYFINDTEYKFGLFDADLHIQTDSIGKDIQDIYNNKEAYIDIGSSFLNTRLFVDGKYYNQIDSSALFDSNGAIYYFKQVGLKRILYKNKQKLFSYNGYFGKIVDISHDKIFFIANTPYGSGLYLYQDGLIYLIDGDNIVDAKVISNNEALVVTINHSAYELHHVSLDKKKIQSPYFKDIGIKSDFHFKSPPLEKSIDGTSYNELSALEYSMLYPYYTFNSESGDLFGMTGLFSDPLMFNQLSLNYHQLEDENIAGLSYLHNRYLPILFNYYKINRDEKEQYKRDYGASISIEKILLQKGRHTLRGQIKYILDSDYNKKSPLIMGLQHAYYENLEQMNNMNNSLLQGFYKKDRQDNIYGIKYKLDTHLKYGFYFDLGIQSLDSDVDNLGEYRGIKIVNNQLELLSDPTNILFESMEDNFFVKNIDVYNIGISKDFYFSSYFYRVPFGIQKQKISYQYHLYQFDMRKKYKMREKKYILNIDLLLGHKFVVPLDIRYITNDDIEESKQVKISLGITF